MTGTIGAYLYRPNDAVPFALTVWDDGNPRFGPTSAPNAGPIEEIAEWAGDILTANGWVTVDGWAPSPVDGNDWRLTVRRDYGLASARPADMARTARGTAARTVDQANALRSLCERYRVPYVASAYAPAFDLPTGYVAGWVGSIYVGCAPDGSISS